MPAKQSEDVFAVIMAGGRGTRFWPLSRSRLPKQLLPIIGETSLLEQVVDRLAPLVPAERLLISTGRELLPAISKLIPEVPRANYVVEPLGRDTAAAIGLSLIMIRDLAGDDAVAVVLPSDHHISQPPRFIAALGRAINAARTKDVIVTLGIRPSFASTSYGYIRQGKQLPGCPGVFKVEEFMEKPGAKKAERLLKEGKVFWNAGMFIMRAGVGLLAFAERLPEMYAVLENIAKVLRTPYQEAVIEKLFPALASISIDYGVMEKADNVVMVPGSFGWSDVGGWQALYKVRGGKTGKNISRGRHLALDSKGCLIESTKLVATIGVDDLVVVETDDAILIVPRGQEGKVKEAVALLEKKGWKKYL